MRAIAINVGANTNLPGFRGRIYPDGQFEYVPIPERESVRESVPTYGDLDLSMDVPPDLLDRPVHLDPEFAEYPECEAYTYGDEHDVKAGPLSKLDPGDYLLFYATLTLASTADADTASSTADADTADLESMESKKTTPESTATWIAPGWGAYLIGTFRVDHTLSGEEYRDGTDTQRSRFRNNAHVKRDPFDAKVLVAGDPEHSKLLVVSQARLES